MSHRALTPLLADGLPATATLLRGLGWLAEADLRDLLAGPDAPTLLLHGDQDLLMPYAAAETLATRDARRPPRNRFAGCAHAPSFRHRNVLSTCCAASAMNLPEKHCIRAAFSRAATTHDAAAVLQREVCRALLDALTTTATCNALPATSSTRAAAPATVPASPGGALARGPARGRRLCRRDGAEGRIDSPACVADIEAPALSRCRLRPVVVEPDGPA